MVPDAASARPKRRRLRRALLAAAILVPALFFILFARTLRFQSKQIEVAAPAPEPAGYGEEAAARLAAVIRFRTVSGDPSQRSPDAFIGLRDYLGAAFPRVHSALGREMVSGDSLLYEWKGRNTGLAPVILAAHLDVVPVEPGTDARWTHPPFSGDIADGHVWGRGALDDKASLTAILQALEDLVAEGFRPARTIYLAFGHDEELGGTSGATAMASRLGRRGVRADFLVDEGMVITEGLMPGVSRPVALIGLAEKGFLSLELTTTVQGGHSSMPPGVTAVGLLARAIERLEANQMPARFSDPGRLTFEYVGPEMPFAARLVLANLWLFRPLLLAQLAGMPTTNASIRTTTAPTMFQAGVKDNVLPASGRAVVNFRILPGDSMAGVIDHVKRTIGDDRIDVHPLANVGSSEPSNVSPVDGRGFGILERTIRELFPETIVAPTLVLGGTDSRHYASITPNIYRFAPIKVKGEDLARAHGTNERISVANYADAVRFYRRLIRNCCRN